MKNDFTAIEAKWHKIWDEKQLYAARTGSDAKKFYALVEFPAFELRIDVPTVPSGSLRVTLMPEARRYGSIRSAMRFIHRRSFPSVT